jgi:hypothetical protein
MKKSPARARFFSFLGRGRIWESARELELDRERRAVPMRCERGYTEQLPDLAVWLKRSPAPGR